jgi:hypothetical protein
MVASFPKNQFNLDALELAPYRWILANDIAQLDSSEGPYPPNWDSMRL